MANMDYKSRGAGAIMAAMQLLMLAEAAAAGGGSTCATAVWDGRASRRYGRCVALGSQGAALAYTYDGASGALDVAFTGTLPAAGGWAGWGINPTGWGMLGASVLVGFRAANGSTVLPYKLDPAAVHSRRPRCSPVDLPLRPASLAVFISAGSGGAVSIFASLDLRRPPRALSPTSLNLIWNRGPAVVAFSPLPHSLRPDDVHGFATLDVTR